MHTKSAVNFSILGKSRFPPKNIKTSTTGPVLHRHCNVMSFIGLFIWDYVDIQGRKQKNVRYVPSLNKFKTVVTTQIMLNNVL